MLNFKTLSILFLSGIMYKIDIQDDKVLQNLIAKLSIEQKLELALNTKSPQLLELLAKEPDPRVKAGVARSDHAPKELLEQLATDSDWVVRAEVARNSNTPEKILWRLAEDPVSIVREAVIENDHAPKELLEKLAKDKDWHVSDAAKDRLEGRFLLRH